MTDQIMCSSGDHGDVPAIGEAQVDEDDPTWYPYCTECLLMCDPPRRWYGEPPFAALGGLSEQESRQLVKVVDEALLANRQQLRDLHHSHASLDANARNLIAEIAVAALLTRPEERDAGAQDDVIVGLHRDVQTANNKLDGLRVACAELETDRDRLQRIVTECYAATLLAIQPSGDDLSANQQASIPAMVHAAIRTNLRRAEETAAEMGRLRAENLAHIERADALEGVIDGLQRDLHRERETKRINDQALLDAVTDRNRLRTLAKAMIGIYLARGGTREALPFVLVGRGGTSDVISAARTLLNESETTTNE